jgi:hypothetical protein
MIGVALATTWTMVTDSLPSALGIGSVHLVALPSPRLRLERRVVDKLL